MASRAGFNSKSTLPSDNTRTMTKTTLGLTVLSTAAEPPAAALLMTDYAGAALIRPLFVSDFLGAESITIPEPLLVKIYYVFADFLGGNSH
jgi:hypothetical protein